MSDQATLDTPVDTAPLTAPVSAPSPAVAPPAANPSPAATAPVPPPVTPPVTPPVEDKGYWPADWREKAAKGEEKRSKLLSRYASPEAAIDALVEVRDRLSKGELKQALKKNATPEEVAAWRADAGIPDSPDKYDIGVQLTETQKPAFDILFKHAHATGQTPEQVKAVAEAWKEIQHQAMQMRFENDEAGKKLADDQLREEWGAEYRRNYNVIDNMLNTVADAPIKDLILEARAPDGSRLGSNPQVLRALLGVALLQNPAGVVVPGHVNPIKGVEDRIAEIEVMMKKDRKAYNDPKISGPGGEYQRLLEAREKMKG